MVKKSLRWAWSHRKTSLALFLLLAFGLLNALAYLHARAMTHYGPAGAGTARPESLTALQKVQVVLTGVTVPRPSAEGATPADVGLAFEVHRLAGQGEVELEAWYVPHSQARGLVLMFHGYAACKAALLPEAAAMHELGYALLLVDFRGSGGSGGSETTIGVLEGEDVARAVDYARAHWTELPLILYGQSMGAAASLRAVALCGVRPQALVLECPFDRLVHTVGNRFAAMGLPAFPGAHLLVFWGGVQHGFDGFAHNPVEYAAQVSCPVLLLHGALDRRVTEEQARAVHGALGGPKELEVFEQAGHESYVARQPERWRQVVSRFLLRSATPTAGSAGAAP
jgi:uncharacterized protein